MQYEPFQRPTASSPFFGRAYTNLSLALFAPARWGTFDLLWKSVTSKLNLCFTGTLVRAVKPEHRRTYVRGQG